MWPMVLTEDEILQLPKDLRSYYHIQNDLIREINENQQLIQMMIKDSFPTDELRYVEGEAEGLHNALSRIQRAISSLENRASKV